MAKIWASNEEFDFEALCEEKDIAALKHMLNADERALFIILITAFLG